MEPDLLEVDGTDAARGLVDLLEPGAEAKVDHAAALEPARLELDRAAGYGAIHVAHRPAGLLAEVERQDRAAGRGAAGQRGDRCRQRSCVSAHRAQIGRSHDRPSRSGRGQNGGMAPPRTSPASAAVAAREACEGCERATCYPLHVCARA
jgi:hypothetical protein